MEIRYEDKKCDNCALCNKVLGPLNYKCLNKNSDKYKEKVKPQDRCKYFKPYSYCLTCMRFDKDAKICRNKKSQYFNKYGVILPKFGCEHKFDAGYVASTISDILELDKATSYSLLLYKLKRELLKIDSNYQRYIDFYQEVSYFFGQSLFYAANPSEEASYYKENFLDKVWQNILNEEYVEAFNIFKGMLAQIDDKYYVVKDDEEYTKLLHC